MMSSKAPRKMIKSMRGSPIRKEHMIKKSVRPSSPLRSSRSSRPPMKHLSPGMKRGHMIPSTSKGLHLSRIRSIASSPHRSVPRHGMPGSPDSVDRSRSYKRSKYEKRKGPSISPVRHPSPIPSLHDRRGSSPYLSDRYLNSRSGAHDDRLEPPSKKKGRREPDRYPHSPSPGLLHKSSNEIPFISDGGLPLRSEINSQSSSVPMMSRNYLSAPVLPERVDRNYRSQLSSSPGPSSQLKRQPPLVKSTYETGISERYKNDVPSTAFPSASDKKYNLTLHERFSTVETEPRIRYSREDLEKITIDIRRNVREPSPTLRQIVNPSDVKLVRRADEGHRPIFDRQEIKQASRDLREDAYFEKKTTSSDRPYPPTHSMGFRDIENYEITRHRFDGHPPSLQSTSNRSLSERWQGPDGRKDGALDRDDREYEKIQSKKSYVEVRNRSKSGDRDFRSERFSGEVSRSRSDYHDSRNHGPPHPSEPRSHIISSKETHPDARRLIAKESRGRSMSPPPPRSHLYPGGSKRFPESLSRMDKPSLRRSPGIESHKYRPRSRSRSRSRSRGKMSEYSRRPDKHSYKSYPDKREFSPPETSYFSHGRDSYDPSRGRGRSSSRPFRSSRGFRSRGFRGVPRGGFRGSPRGGGRGRGSPFRGRSSLSTRGRGGPRRGRYSPHMWKHDMYSQLSPERK